MSKKAMKIIVNSITTSRLVLAIFLICLINTISNYTFLTAMAILYSTDFLDGFLARKYNVQTLYGGIMDTLADKTLNIALLLPLIKEIPLFLIILILELVIMTINTFAKLIGKHVITKNLGKLKMWFVATTIALGYLTYFDIFNININIPIIITSIINAFVMIDYIVYLIIQKREIKPLKFKDKNDFIYKMFDTEYFLNNN